MKDKPKLAKKIIKALLSVGNPDGNGIVGDRMQIMKKDSLGREQNMGGRNETSMLNCILGELYCHESKTSD